MAVLEVILVVELQEYLLLPNECVGEVALSPPLLPLVVRPPLSSEDVLLLILVVVVVTVSLLELTVVVRVILLLL